MAGILSSVMEEVVKSFAGQSFKKQTILNAMKNRGVKDAELEQSGMKKFIEEYKGEKISVEELQGVINKREDTIAQHGEKREITAYDPNKEYATIREKQFQPPEFVGIPRQNFTQAGKLLSQLAKETDSSKQMSLRMNISKLGHVGSMTSKTLDENLGKINPTDIDKLSGKYTAKVYSKGKPHGVSNHFDVPDYYAHTRYTDVAEGNRNTRYVHEIQSDVHQGAKDLSVTDDGYEDVLHDEVSGFAEFYASGDRQADSMEEFDSFLENQAHTLMDLLSRDPEWIKSEAGAKWIKANANPTSESSLQALQEQAVESATRLKSRRKTTDFKQDEDYLKNTVNKLLVDSANEGKQSVKFRIAPDEKLYRSEGIQKWYEKDVVNTLQKQAKKIGSEMRMTEDGYAEIDIPEKDFKLPMYSAAGLGVFTASMQNREAMAKLPDQISKAKAAGYNDDQIKEYLAPKYDENVLGRALQLGQPKQELEAE